MNGLGMTLIVTLYVACELIANITAGRAVSLFGLTAPGGVFIYALTFTLIDLINERLGKAGARRVVAGAFAANVLFALYTTLVLALPAPAFFERGDAFAAVLGATPRVVIASLTAYIVSSLIDVEIFAAWKRRVGGYKWVRVVASNVVSTAIDSALFVAIAFAGSLPLLPLIFGQYLIKMAVTVVSLPLIYATKEINAETEKI
jgi:queuosine precursor transporter